MSKGIILIGPEKSGKTTVGLLLAESLGLPFYDLSVDSHRYRRKTAFDPVQRDKHYQEAGFDGVFNYMMPIRARVVELALADYGVGVIELGAFYAVYDEDSLLRRVKRAVSGYDKVVLLLPEADIEQSVRILQARGRIVYRGMDWNEYFVRQPSNRRLANHVVYTKDQTPEETTAEIMSMLDRNSSTICLLGPVGVGKTTIGRLLSARLNLPQVSSDGLRRRYYSEVGYSREEENRIAKISGDEGVLDYWKKFDGHAIKRLLEEYSEAVIDFGAGQTVFEDEADLAMVESLLSPFPNRFLLMPSPRVEESLNVLSERVHQRTSIRGSPRETFLITHPSIQMLATGTIYTNNKTPDQIRDEILPD